MRTPLLIRLSHGCQEYKGSMFGGRITFQNFSLAACMHAHVYGIWMCGTLHELQSGCMCVVRLIVKINCGFLYYNNTMATPLTLVLVQH